MRLLHKPYGMADLADLQIQLGEAVADLEFFTHALQRDAELFPFLEDEDPC